jgi:ribosomal protein L11 methyltransferase
MRQWIELRVIVPRTRVKPLTQLLARLGALGMEEAVPPGVQVEFRQPWDTAPPAVSLNCWLKAWFEPDLADQAALALEQASGLPVDQVVVQEEDWAQTWQKHHKRVAISERLSVSPPWDAVPGDVIIPPGNAFGTGDHPTTQACLGAIDRLADRCHTLLDVGCGSGVLALAGAQLGLRCVGVDIELDAVHAARENAALNRLDAEFSTQPLAQVPGTYDLVVANVYAEVLVMLAPDLLRVTGKHLVLAGILADRADQVIDALSPPLALQAQIREGDWLSLHLERP